MGKNKVETYFKFKYNPTIDIIKSETPFLEKLEKMAIINSECDNRLVEIESVVGSKVYRVTEQKYATGGEGGVELINVYLGRYIYRKKGDDIERFKGSIDELWRELSNIKYGKNKK